MRNRLDWIAGGGCNSRIRAPHIRDEGCPWFKGSRVDSTRRADIMFHPSSNSTRFKFEGRAFPEEDHVDEGVLRSWGIRAGGSRGQKRRWRLAYWKMRPGSRYQSAPDASDMGLLSGEEVWKRSYPYRMSGFGVDSVALEMVRTAVGYLSTQT